MPTSTQLNKVFPCTDIKTLLRYYPRALTCVLVELKMKIKEGNKLLLATTVKLTG